MKNVPTTEAGISMQAFRQKIEMLYSKLELYWLFHILACKDKGGGRKKLKVQLCLLVYEAQEFACSRPATEELLERYDCMLQKHKRKAELVDKLLERYPYLLRMSDEKIAAAMEAIKKEMGAAQRLCCMECPE